MRRSYMGSLSFVSLKLCMILMSFMMPHGHCKNYYDVATIPGVLLSAGL
jgi:hypothetical protein